MSRKMNEYAWECLSEHLDAEFKDYVLLKFSDCFDYSPDVFWAPMIADIVKLMKRREDYDNNIDYKVVQVKRKFGLLRFYVNGCDDYLRGVIALAEWQCTQLCKKCGSYGKEKITLGSYNGGHCVDCCNLHY
tara:strand:+ start:2951 stop:3346 length:396 start_codon:yes stop_codon:yes gene_type:complete